MTNSKIYDFFLADGYRIAINIMIFFELLFLIIIIWKTLSRKKSSFNLLFLLMLNSIIAGNLSALGYILNWKVHVDGSTEKKLLFGDSESFICQTQSFMIAYFQSTRETFCSLMIFIVFISSKIKNFDIKNIRPLHKFYILFLGNFIPFIANIIYLIAGMFGETHLFCFTKMDVPKETSICGTIHFAYMIIIILLSFILTLYIIIQDCKNKENVWANLDNNNKKKCFSDPQLKKIVIYPFAQIITNVFVFYNRFVDWYIEDTGERRNNKRTGMAGVVNTTSSLLYIIIFIVSNNILCSDEENENAENAEKEKDDDNTILMKNLNFT